jgi:hypothetical protein
MSNEICIIDNGYIKPTVDELQKYIEGPIIVRNIQHSFDIENVEYPINLTLIGYQVDYKMCYKQDFVVKNNNQFKHVYSFFARYGEIVPGTSLNKKGIFLRKDYIITQPMIDDYSELL